MAADLADGVVQALQSGRNALLGPVMRQIHGRLQAHADLEQAGRHLVEQLPAALRLPGRGSGPDGLLALAWPGKVAC